MSVCTSLGFVAFMLLCLTIGVMLTAVHLKMIDEVNARLEETDRFEAFGWHYATLHKVYRRLYPEGRLVHHEVLLRSVFTVLLITVAWRIGFPLWLLVFFGSLLGVSLWLTYRK